MERLLLHEFHERAGARFTNVNGSEVPGDYNSATNEYLALRESAGLLDLSFRSRLCLTGADRVRFLHGQVTNDVKSLQKGEGCYAALVTAKGRMESDLNVMALADEILLDFEPGLTETVSQRLEKYIVADDVQVVNVSTLYGLLSIQGPQAEAAVRSLELFTMLPAKPLGFFKCETPGWGELYLVNHPRLGTKGFDLYVPIAVLDLAADEWSKKIKSFGGLLSGWHAFEISRVEAGIPRFGQDMDGTNFPQECGIESRAVSYQKGCYIGQEVLNRIHTMGHVNRTLQGLRLADHLEALPQKGDKLFHDGKEVGYVTSAINSPVVKANLALGYVRRESNQIGAELRCQVGAKEIPAHIVELPFQRAIVT